MSDLLALLPQRVSLDDRTPHQVVEDQWAWWHRVRDSHSSYVDAAIQCEKFYLGDQWKDTDRSKLESEGRPALTINMVLSTVNTLLGEHALKRADVMFEPARGGDERVAGIISKLFEEITEDNDYGMLEHQVFADGLIQRRGWFDVRVEPDENLTGSVRIREIDPLEIVIDPQAKKYSPATWAEVGRTWWASLDDLAADYGLSNERLAAIASTADSDQYGHDAVTLAYNTFGGTTSLSPYSDLGEASSMTARKRYRVLERQYALQVSVRSFVDPNTGDKRRVPELWDAKRAEDFAAQHGLFLHHSRERRIRWTVTAGRELIYDAWSPYRSFTLLPFFPYFRRGKPMGVIDNLISPQEQLNKIASQELHVINTTANSGWMVPSGTLTNMTTDELKAHGSQTGLVLEFNGTKGEPKKIQPNQIPAALDRAEQKSLQNLMQISGVNPGQPTREPAQSMDGKTLEFLRDRTNVQTQVIMENLAYTRRLLAHKVLELVQDFYTHERVVQCTADRNADEQTIINQINAAGEVVNDITKGTYRAVITMVPSRDTYRENQFIEAMALLSAGVPVRPERVAQLSSIETRDEIAAEIAADHGRAPLSPEEQAMQQVQMDMQFQQMQLQLQELGATVQKLLTEAELNMAKAGAAEAMVEVAHSQIEADVQINRDNAGLRQSLAQLSAAAKIDTNVISAQTRAMLQESKQAHDTQKTLLTMKPAVAPEGGDVRND